MVQEEAIEAEENNKKEKVYVANVNKWKIER
jgi:hypothetical protein